MLWFLSEPEHRLAHRLTTLPKLHSVTGAAVHVPASYDVDGFRARHNLTRPYVMFAGTPYAHLMVPVAPTKHEGMSGM